MPIYLTSASGNQDGYNNAGAWDGTAVTMGGTGGQQLGLRFKIFTGSTDSEGRRLDPPRMYSPFSLTLYTASIPAQTVTLSLRFVPEAAPDAYSTSALPGSRNDTISGGGSFKDFYGATVSVGKTIAVGTAADTAVTWDDIDIYSLLAYTNLATWNGYICLTVPVTIFGASITFHTAEGANSSYVPALTTNEVAFHTGVLEGPAMDRRARSRIDPRLGIPVASDSMVRDGYKEGLMVDPAAWDPEDPEDRYVPNPNEGVVDDEV